MLKDIGINAAIAQTHILIIGVGHYPYLQGGSQEKQQLDGLNGLKQLTSTVESAIGLFNTAMELHRKSAWIKPLGSVDLLISRPLPGETGFDPPTHRNIQRAYFDWKTRCEKNEDNTAIFFFAGHGMERGNHLLLLEDFGEIPANPWSGAFELDRTRLAFQRANVNTQCFFIDSCREVNSVLTRFDVVVAPFEMPNIRASECQFDLTIKGTARNLSAYGLQNQVSFFTQSLIKALEGYASVDQGDGDWIVDMSSISSQITPIMKLINEEQAFEQRFVKGGTDSADLIKLPHPPKALLRVSCNPEGALPLAGLNCTPWDENNSTWADDKAVSRDAKSTPWDVELEAGRYMLAAKFNKTYKPASKPGFVRPPFTKETIKCQPL